MSIHILLVQNQHVPALVLVNPCTSSHPSTDINGSIQMRLLCLEDPREVCGTHPWATFVKMIIIKRHTFSLYKHFLKIVHCIAPVVKVHSDLIGWQYTCICCVGFAAFEPGGECGKVVILSLSILHDYIHMLWSVA